MLLFFVLIAVVCSGNAQGAPDSTGGKGRILLVLPFDNNSGQPSLDWIREAAAELLNSRFTSAGFAPLSRADRLYALDHLGLPQGFQPSRASSLKLAETLDADDIVVGSYRTDGDTVEAEARIVNVPDIIGNDYFKVMQIPLLAGFVAALRDAGFMGALSQDFILGSFENSCLFSCPVVSRRIMGDYFRVVPTGRFACDA